MRARILLVSLLLICATSATPVDAASGDSGSLAYNNRIQSIVTSRVISALIPHFWQLQRGGSGTVGVRFRVLATGEVESVTLIQRHPLRLVNNTCTHVISGTKFPPIPAKVLREEGHPYVDVTSTIRVN